MPKTVLIVDDDDLVLESIDLLLSAAEGFQTIKALGVTGAAMHMQHLAHIDVIVADVILAGTTTGLDLCRQAISRYPGIAIVVITADTETHCADIPPRGVFLRKPFGAEPLLDAIGEALRKAAALPQTPAQP